MCERREKHHRKPPQPIVHPDVASAGTEGTPEFRFSEDSRPMFSPIPTTSESEEEDSPRPAACRGTLKERSAFPAIHVERCDCDIPAYASAAYSPESPVIPNSPGESDLEPDYETMSTSQSSGGLSVPSPFLHRKADGRVVLVTQECSSRGAMTSWSRSEGNLPEAIRRSQSTPGSHSQLLDVRYRPDWPTRPTLRQHSDHALHETSRRNGRGAGGQPGRGAGPASDLPLTDRLQLLSLAPGQRALSADDLQQP